MLADAGISPGVMKPFVRLVEHGGNAARGRREERAVPGSWRRGAARPGIAAADSLVEAFPRSTARRPASRRSIDRVNDALEGTARRSAAAGGRPRLPARRLRNFPYVLAFVLLLTLILLTRAFRSIVLAIKARPQPHLARRGVRDHRLHLPDGHGSSLWNITRRRRSPRGSR
jgi:RND superfamily putative drug exporter